MNRGLAYQEVFPDHADRERFLELLGECHEMWGAQGPQDNRARLGVSTQRLIKEARWLGDMCRSKHFSTHEPRAALILYHKPITRRFRS